MDEAKLEQLWRDVQTLKDRQAILDCIMREARGRDRQDVDITASCYWPEGCDEHGPVITPAPDYPARANAGHAAYFAATSHNITNHSCELAGDVAYCETYVVGGLLSKDEKTCKIAPARYIDQLEKRSGEWRILIRRTVIEMCVEGDASWLHSPAIAGFLRGLWTKDDPSYHRPVRLNPDDTRW
jgi:hypothetical protein